MEEHLKEILKRNTTYSDLSEAEREQMIEWFSDDEEFQSLKVLFQQVDAWSDSNKEETNTKLRLDHLYAIQYAGKQSTKVKSEFGFGNRGIRNLVAWVSVSAVAAALVLTWMVLQPEERTLTAKNEKKVKGEMEEKTEEKNNPDQKMKAKFEQEAPVKLDESEEFKLIQNDAASIEFDEPTTSWTNVVAEQKDVVSGQSPSSLTIGSSVTLSTVGATSFSWTPDHVNSAPTISINGDFYTSNVSEKKVQTKKKSEAVSFKSLSVKSMPEMLDNLVAAY
jgi:hypothetical protein